MNKYLLTILGSISMIIGMTTQAQTVIEADFESGSIFPFVLQSSNGNSASVLNWGESARMGSRVVKLSWYEDNYQNNRSTRGIEVSSEDVIRIKEEGWYGFSFFVNESGSQAFRFDTEIAIAQALANGGNSCSILSWTWILNTGPDGVVLSHRYQLTSQTHATLSPTVPTGRWVDVIVHMKYGTTFDQPNTGLIEVWFDDDCQGEKGPPSYSYYDTRLGTGCFNNDSLITGTHLKYGMYCHTVDDYIDGEKRVIYFDQVTGIDGNPDNSWYLVNPHDPTGATPPAVPSGVTTFQASDATLEINWVANIEPDLSGYNIYRSANPGGVFTKLNTTLLTGPSYTDTTAAIGTYYYALTAVDSDANESALSSETSGTLSSSVPFTIFEAESFNAQNGGIQTEACSDDDGGLNVAYISKDDWTRYDNINLTGAFKAQFRVARPAGKSDGRIEIRLDSSTGTLVGSVDVPETGGWQNWVTVDTTLTPAIGEHSIYLKYLEVDASTEASIFNLNWFALAILEAPSDLTAAPATVSQIDLSWSAAAGATAYHLKRSTTSDGPYSTVDGELASTSFSDAAVSGGVRYYYVVSAIIPETESDDSTETSAVPSALITEESLIIDQANITSDGADGKNFSISFSGSGLGHSYQVQYSDSLDSSDWHEASDIKTGNGGNLEFGVEIPAEHEKRFYRVRIWRQ